MKNLNKDQVQRLDRMDALLDGCLLELGAPQVLFLNDIQSFARRTLMGVNAHNTKRLRLGMTNRGYAPARPPLGEKCWRNGEFRSAIAFVSFEIPKEDRTAAVRAALEGRESRAVSVGVLDKRVELALAALEKRVEALEKRIAAMPESRESVEATRPLLLQFFEEHGKPHVIFHRDLSDFAARRQEGELVTRALNAKNFTLESHGYAAVRNPDAAEWKRSKFRTRTAYVRDDVEVEDRAAVVREELENRGS